MIDLGATADPMRESASNIKEMRDDT